MNSDNRSTYHKEWNDVMRKWSKTKYQKQQKKESFWKKLKKWLVKDDK